MQLKVESLAFQQLSIPQSPEQETLWVLGGGLDLLNIK